MTILRVGFSFLGTGLLYRKVVDGDLARPEAKDFGDSVGDLTRLLDSELVASVLVLLRTSFFLVS